MTPQQSQSSRPGSPASDSNERNSFLDGGEVSVRESACRSLRILLPILALYTLFSLAWTTPIASVLHTVSSGNTIKHRTPKDIETNPTIINTNTNTNTDTNTNTPPLTTTTTTTTNSDIKSTTSTTTNDQEQPATQTQVKTQQQQPPTPQTESKPDLQQQQPPVQVKEKEDQAPPQAQTEIKQEQPVQPPPPVQAPPATESEKSMTSTTTTTSNTNTPNTGTSIDTPNTVTEKIEQVEQEQQKTPPVAPPVQPPPQEQKTIDSSSTSTTTSSLPSPVVRPATERRKTYNLDAPSCMLSGKRAKTFLMVFMGHSGSTAIMSELKAHPQIHFEQFEPVDHGDIQQNNSMALEYTRQFFERGISQGKVPGFKIRPLHIREDPQSWVKLARDYETRIVWQYRRNSLKQAIGEYSYRVLKDNSIIEGLKTEDEVKNRCDTGAGCSFKIDDFHVFHEILSGVTRSDFAIADAANLISDGRDCVHEVRYEDYLYHREGTMLDLLQFLGVDLITTEPQRYKATNDNICEVVENWHDFCRAFYGCKVWRPLFEDAENGCSCRFSSSPPEFCVTPRLA